MDPKEIRELIELISRSSFQSFELEREGFRLKLVKSEGGQLVVAAPQPVADPGLVAVPRLAATEDAPAAAPDNGVTADGLQELRSPIVGTFYRSPGPDDAPFADVGSRIRRGQVVCIVEAMKVMNEIEAEIDAEVVEILVANGQPVEFGEPLFRLRPLS